MNLLFQIYAKLALKNMDIQIDYPDEESYDNISDYQEALDWWESNREDISVSVELITEDLIEKLGKDYYLWDKSEPDYDLTK